MMWKSLISLSLVAIVGCGSGAAVTDMRKCFSKLNELDIRPKLVFYSQIVGKYYGQAYCRVDIDEEHPYSCVKLVLHPQRNPHFGLFSLSILPKGQNKTEVFKFKVFPTLFGGIFILAQDASFKDARVMVVLDHGPNLFVYYLCSTTAETPSRHYNDFRMNTVKQDVHFGHMIRQLRQYLLVPTCNYFSIPQFNCPKTTI